MSEVPSRWGAYARLQAKLARKDQLDGHAWGLEAGLNWMLARPGEPLTQVDGDRVVHSTIRKERYRARLRRVHLAGVDLVSPPDDAVDARLQLRSAEAMVAPDEWVVLYAVGVGYEYSEIAAAVGVSAGALRLRVFRLRHALNGQTVPGGDRGGSRK